MTLPVTVSNGFSVKARALFLVVAVAAAGLVFLHTPWGQLYAPDWGALFYRLRIAPVGAGEISGAIIFLWMAWWLCVPQTAWIIDTDGVRRVIYGFFGRRSAYFPVSAIAEISVREIDYHDRPHYWLLIRLTSGKRLKFRVGPDLDEANDIQRELIAAGAGA